MDNRSYTLRFENLPDNNSNVIVNPSYFIGSVFDRSLSSMPDTKEFFTGSKHSLRSFFCEESIDLFNKMSEWYGIKDIVGKSDFMDQLIEEYVARYLQFFVRKNTNQLVSFTMEMENVVSALFCTADITPYVRTFLLGFSEVWQRYCMAATADLSNIDLPEVTSSVANDEANDEAYLSRRTKQICNKFDLIDYVYYLMHFLAEIDNLDQLDDDKVVQILIERYGRGFDLPLRRKLGLVC